MKFAKNRWWFFSFFTLFFLAQAAIAAPKVIREIESKAKPITLVELFTSEGCSSCPPAEAKLSQLRQSKKLWSEIVPVAYHVDYWDDLGWIDPFAQRQFTLRQKAYARTYERPSVYTPNFVVAGKEWRRWANKPFPETALTQFPGTLKATIYSNHQVKVKFWPADQSIKQWKIEGTLLENGIQSKVKSGENNGRTLNHEFVAVNLQRRLAILKNDSAETTLDFSSFKEVQNAKGPKAIALWVIPRGSLMPIQAVGGFLQEK